MKLLQGIFFCFCCVFLSYAQSLRVEYAASDSQRHIDNKLALLDRHDDYHIDPSLLEKQVFQTKVLLLNPSRSHCAKKGIIKNYRPKYAQFFGAYPHAHYERYIKDYDKQEMRMEAEIGGKDYKVIKKMDVPNWKITKETKKIGNYVCKKATLHLEEKGSAYFDLLWMNGPGPPENETEKRNVDIANVMYPQKFVVWAWFTEEIPISDGPLYFHGLPGLILELDTGVGHYYVTSIKEIDGIWSFAPIEGKEITEKAFKNIYYDLVKKDKVSGSNEKFIKK